MASLLKRGRYWHMVYYDEAGKQRRISTKQETRKAAEAWVKAYEAEKKDRLTGQAATPKEPVDRTWAQCRAAYERWAEPRKAPDTVKLEGYTFDHFEEKAKPSTMASVTKARVEAFIRRCLADGMKPVTVNGHLRRLRAFFNHCKDLRLYTGPNPLKNVKLLPEGERIPRWLDERQFDRVLQAAKKHSDDAHLLVALGGLAGLRKNEILNARWEWVNFERRTVTVQPWGRRHEGGFEPKSGRRRTLPLSPKLQEILEPHRRPSGYIVKPDKKPGRRYRWDPRETVDLLQKRTGIRFTLHVLRHTFVSKLVQENVSIFKAAQWVGHRDIKVTADIYAHLAPYDPDIEKLQAPPAKDRLRVLGSDAG